MGKRRTVSDIRADWQAAQKGSVARYSQVPPAVQHADMGVLLRAWQQLADRLQQADESSPPAAGTVHATADMTLGEVLDALMDGEGGQGHA